MKLNSPVGRMGLGGNGIILMEVDWVMSERLQLDRGRIEEFCRRWNVTELALFGSVLREDFRPDSDVDVLVAFAPDSHTSLFDLVDMEEELADIVGRKVDLVCREGIERSHNYIRRQAILNAAEVVYAARPVSAGNGRTVGYLDTMKSVVSS